MEKQTTVLEEPTGLKANPVDFIDVFYLTHERAIELNIQYSNILNSFSKEQQETKETFKTSDILIAFYNAGQTENERHYGIFQAGVKIEEHDSSNKDPLADLLNLLHQ